ncbi:MAG: amino acid-binding protein [Candidatus Aenigmatarchaeota archaeon]|nr:amino acid-binding protein [Candidatus Aenigmarchaeota archaeon]
MKQFDVTIENKMGALAELCDMLARNAINIKAISTDIRNGFGIVHLVTEDHKTTKETLQKSKFKFDETEILAVRLPDRPGELAKAAKLLSRAKINIENLFLLGGDGEFKEIAFKVSDIDKAKEVLK